MREKIKNGQHRYKEMNNIDINREGIKWKMNDELTYLYYRRIEVEYGREKKMTQHKYDRLQVWMLRMKGKLLT